MTGKLRGKHLPPERFCQVSATQLSIARYYGAAKVNGHSYTYDPKADMLIRDDVLRHEAKLRKAAEKAERQTADEERELREMNDPKLF
jgi:hypothetical protein